MKQAYLAGGTAAALQLGHRISRDLDFFTVRPFDEKIVGQALEDSGLKRMELNWRTVLGQFKGVSFSYFYYKYPLLAPVHTFDGIAIADLRDIAAMKIDAIATRGIRRDFVDLHAIMHDRSFTLPAVIELYKTKYGMQRDMIAHALRSLTYFDDAEGEAYKQERPLESLVPIAWEEIKAFFRKEVEKTSHRLLEG